MSGAGERANGRASGLVLTSVFFSIIDHSAPSRVIKHFDFVPVLPHFKPQCSAAMEAFYIRSFYSTPAPTPVVALKSAPAPINAYETMNELELISFADKVVMEEESEPIAPPVAKVTHIFEFERGKSRHLAQRSSVLILSTPVPISRLFFQKPSNFSKKNKWKAFELSINYEPFDRPSST